MLMLYYRNHATFVGAEVTIRPNVDNTPGKYALWDRYLSTDQPCDGRKKKWGKKKKWVEKKKWEEKGEIGKDYEAQWEPAADDDGSETDFRGFDGSEPTAMVMMEFRV